MTSRKIALPRISRAIFVLLLNGAFGFALPFASVNAQCTQWDVSGKWGIQQSNGYTTMVVLQQSGRTVTGTASYTGKTKGPVSGIVEKVNPVTGKVIGDIEPKTSVKHQGAVSGNVDGDNFHLEISWEGGGGMYNGKIGGDGRIQGTTYDRNHPSSKADWSSTAAMNCAPGPKAPPKVIKSTGKSKPEVPVTTVPSNTPISKLKIKDAEPTTASTSAANAPVPATQAQAGGKGGATITASPQVVPISASGTGTTTLSWNGGADHPYAEVWVKVGDEDEKFVVEQGKGGRKVTVEAGKTYLYILTDAGKRLATVTVKAKQ